MKNELVNLTENRIGPHINEKCEKCVSQIFESKIKGSVSVCDLIKGSSNSKTTTNNNSGRRAYDVFARDFFTSLKFALGFFFVYSSSFSFRWNISK